ncbi:MAG: hypothetical protein J2P47_05525 [Acetobacteraceae bacterium]|nr:hypothetical protein [Acetobacteraceae bacterium]
MALLTALAACAGEPLAADPVDGIYHGTSRRYRADSRACPSPGLIVLRVVNGSFQYRWGDRTVIDATIAPGGAIAGARGAINLSGRLAQGRIEGDVSNEPCAYHFRAVRRAQ